LAAVIEKDLFCTLQVGIDLRLKHLFVNLAHGVYVSDKMLKILIRGVSKSMVESYHGGDGDGEKGKQHQKNGHGDEFRPDSQISE
jgi:hypothetical protein